MDKIILVVANNTDADVSTAKEEVINYLGKRLAETDEEDLFSPIRVKKGDDVTAEDLQQINAISKERSCVSIVLEYDTKNFDSYSGKDNIVLATMSTFPAK